MEKSAHARRGITAVFAALALVAGGAMAAAPASASDWGGYANPAAAGCGSNSLVASIPVMYQGKSNRYSLGTLQIKWSNGCPGNYARFEAAQGVKPQSIALSIHGQSAPFNKAGTDEKNVGVAFTYVIKLARSSDRVCAYLDATTARPSFVPQSEPATLSASATVCA